MAARMTPTVAATAAARYRVNVPTRTRNSLTNVDSPGRDSMASPETRNSPASTGATLRPAPRDHEPGDDEQGAGGKAVVDHVQRGARLPLAGQHEDAQRDQAEVGDGGVGDQPLDVGLADRDHRPVQ